MALTFSPEQLEQASEQRFERRLIGVLTKVDPTAAAVLGTVEGAATLHLQCDRARAAGMQSELDVSRYVVTAWLLGLDFDTRFPAIAEVLSTTRLSPLQKGEAIERICTAVLIELRQGKVG